MSGALDRPKLFIKRSLNALGANRLVHTIVFRSRKAQPVTYRGVNFRCSPAIGYEAQLLAGEYNEDRVIDFMIGRLRGLEGIFLDIGANIGVFSLTLASTCGFPVIAFEPEPLNFMKLVHNVQLNPRCKVEPVNLACGDRDGVSLEFTVPFQKNRGVPFVGRLPNPPLFAWELAVPAVCVDTWLRQHAVGRISGFKIDVESFEEPVLRGMEGVLTQSGPVRGLVELHPHYRPVNCEAIVALLRQHGFSIKELCRDGSTTEHVLSRMDGHAIWVEKD